MSSLRGVFFSFIVITHSVIRFSYILHSFMNEMSFKMKTTQEGNIKKEMMCHGLCDDGK